MYEQVCEASEPQQDGVPSAVTRAVVDELVARRIEQYPADIVELAKQCVTDFLAVTLAGHAGDRIAGCRRRAA